MVYGVSFARFVKGGEGGEGALKLHIINLRNQKFNTDSCSVNEPCKKKRMCVVLNWIAH